jgi:hypothetical protein
VPADLSQQAARSFRGAGRSVRGFWVARPAPETPPRPSPASQERAPPPGRGAGTAGLGAGKIQVPTQAYRRPPSRVAALSMPAPFQGLVFPGGPDLGLKPQALFLRPLWGFRPAARRTRHPALRTRHPARRKLHPASRKLPSRRWKLPAFTWNRPARRWKLPS